MLTWLLSLSKKKEKEKKKTLNRSCFEDVRPRLTWNLSALYHSLLSEYSEIPQINSGSINPEVALIGQQSLRSDDLKAIVTVALEGIFCEQKE